MKRQITQDLDDSKYEQIEEEAKWGVLISINPAQSDDITLIGNECSIGRASENTVVIPDQRLSSKHCKIIKKIQNGKVIVEVQDFSTNGTYINSKKIGKGNTLQIQNEDQLFLLPLGKINQDETIGFNLFIEEQGRRNRLQSSQEEQKWDKLKDNKKQKLNDVIGEEMMCSICIDIIYQCVTLVPCMHNFCGACVSDWLQSSTECPQCRKPATEAKKNPVINNIVEHYLDANPEKKRSKEEYEEMNKHNKILLDSFKIENKKSNGNIQNDDYLTPDNSDEEQKVQCLECTRRGVGGFQCSRNQRHLICASCGIHFPLRTDDRSIKQTCYKYISTYINEMVIGVICNANFCNLYWKCKNHKKNQLILLKNFKAPATLDTNSIFRGNAYEAKLLRDFLQKNNIQTSRIFQLVMNNLVEKQKFTYEQNRSMISGYKGSSLSILIQPDNSICTNCTQNVWFQMVFAYRKQIKDDLPQKDRNRPACYWGINCTSMNHNKQHAEKFDHFVAQTKFA